MKNNLIFELAVKSRKELIPAVAMFVKHALQAHNVSNSSVLNSLELITEEACLNTVTHAYCGKADETYSVSLAKSGASIILAIEDQGLPMDYEKVKKGGDASIGYKLIWAFADNVTFLNLGKNGKRIEFTKDLSLSEMPREFAESSSDEIVNTEDIAPMDTPIEFRLMQSDEGVALARCLYRVYGYSYRDFVYYPEKIKTMIEDGRLVSMVAVNPEGEIVAHQGLIKASGGSVNAEIAMGVVDPRYRGRKLFETIKEKSFAYIKQQGVVGLFAEAVTKHPYSQRANYATGSRETGILLGYVPENLDFKGFDNGNTGSVNSNKRAATIFMYNRLCPGSAKLVWAPELLKNAISGIYLHGGFERSFGNIPEQKSSDNNAIIDIVLHDFSIAFATVKQYGSDFIAKIKSRTIELGNAGFACIFLDLPMSMPETRDIYTDLREIGYFFCGILPEVDGEDYLRVQYLHNVTVVREEIVLASEFSKQLLDVVWKEYEETAPARCN